jgi:hypothetical protein
MRSRLDNKERLIEMVILNFDSEEIPIPYRRPKIAEAVGVWDRVRETDNEVLNPFHTKAVEVEYRRMSTFCANSIHMHSFRHQHGDGTRAEQRRKDKI